MANVDNCSTIFIYLDVQDQKVGNWLKDVAYLFTNKEFIFCHSSWNTTMKGTPKWLKHIPGIVTFSFPTCAIGAGHCNQMARLTSNSINLKPIRKCKCHKRSFSDGFARTDSVLGLISWYRDNVIGVQPFLEISPIMHNLNQTTFTNPVTAHAICSAGQTSVPPATTDYTDNVTATANAMCSAGHTSVPPVTETHCGTRSSNALITPTTITKVCTAANALASMQTEYVPDDYCSHRASNGESNITLTVKALKSGIVGGYST